MDWKASLESLKSTLPEDREAVAGTDSTPASPNREAVDGPALPGNARNTPAALFPAEKARLDILLDKKGRKGKAATIIAGFTVDDETVDEIARRLKQRLATGGSARGGEILIQGDKRREAETALRAFGLKCRII